NRRLDRVSRLIDGFETPYGMELLATVHWVAQKDPSAATDATRAIDQVHRWDARKRRVFESDHIFRAWQHLHAEGWLHMSEMPQGQRAELPTSAAALLRGGGASA